VLCRLVSKCKQESARNLYLNRLQTRNSVLHMLASFQKHPLIWSQLISAPKQLQQSERHFMRAGSFELSSLKNAAISDTERERERDRAAPISSNVRCTGTPNAVAQQLIAVSPCLQRAASTRFGAQKSQLCLS
jgi:hypothetical protein